MDNIAFQGIFLFVYFCYFFSIYSLYSFHDYEIISCTFFNQHIAVHS